MGPAAGPRGNLVAGREAGPRPNPLRPDPPIPDP